MRRWACVSLLLLGGCGRPPAEPPPPDAEFVLTVYGYPHQWTRYSCTVVASLTPLAGGPAKSDSVIVGADEETALTLSVSSGSYAADFSVRWEGRPGTTWDLTGGPSHDRRTVEAPGSHRIDCP